MLTVDTSYMKRRFYASCNNLLVKCKYASENVKLHLVKSFCLPLITYCIAALDLKTSKVRDLAIGWNDAFRRIFKFNRWESVKDLQCYCCELPFEHLYNLLRWKFLTSTEHTCMSTAFLYDTVKFQHKLVANFESIYRDIRSKCRFKSAVTDYFVSSRLNL